MSHILKRILPTAVLGLLSLWFWAIVSPNTLHFHETAQFFPYTWTHLREALGIPGGPARYVSEFFVQFFLYAFPAGLIVSLFLCALQGLSWKLACQFRKQESEALYPLSFIVPFCAWTYLCDFGNMFTGIVALTGVLAGACLYFNKERSWGAAALTTLLLYWTCGPLAGIFVLLLALHTILKGGKAWPVIAALALWALLPFLWHYCIQYTLKELYLGNEYYHEPQKWSAGYWILAASPLAVCLVQGLLPAPREGRGATWSWLIGSILVFGLGWFWMIRHCNPTYERIFKYDKMALHQDWDGILAKAKKVPPRTLAEATAVNLSMAMQGRLLTDLFQFQQPGPTSLFPDYASGYVVTLTAGESVYRAGLLSTARHYAFEEYESYPNYQVSARHMKRVAEIDLMHGQYTLARRFLKDLSHTLFYRKWAKRYLEDPTRIEEDPEYQRLMQYRDSSDFLYSDSSDDDKREMLRHIVAKDGQVSVPMQYLLAYDLLARDLFSLRVHLLLIDFKGEVPPLIQQAAAMFDGAFFEVAPEERALVSDEIRKQYSDFQTALIEDRSGGEIKARFGKTYWYYYSQKQ